METGIRLIVAMIPTYNEAENIGPLVGEILGLSGSWETHVLVVDDNSPDGTAGLVRDLAAGDPRVHLLLRTKRRGRGAAGVDGFKAALALGADRVVEMDGDFSHQPRFIPDLVAATETADVAIGSRFVAGGRTPTGAWSGGRSPGPSGGSSAASSERPSATCRPDFAASRGRSSTGWTSTT